MDTNADHAARREAAREEDTGRFGEHTRTDAEPTLNLDDDGWRPSAVTYEMPASRLGEAVKRIERANRRLERSGIAERFTYETEKFVHYERENPIGVQAVRLTLDTPRIGMAGWTFVAAHEMTVDGKIISYGSARIDEMRCDHCGSARRRGKVYTVAGPDGEQSVVGSNCLAVFLGVKPEGLWSLTFDLEDGREEDDSPRWSAATGDIVLEPLDLLGAGLAASNEGREFIPRSRASVKDPATVDRILMNLRPLVEAGKTEERRARAKEILDWVNSQPAGNDYIDNLRTVLAGEDRIVGKKHFGIGVSAISAYRNARERAVKQEAARKRYTPGHLAPVGERLRGREVTVISARFYDGDYGGSTRLTMQDNTTGHQLVWWASGNKENHVEEGGTMLLTATVKAHVEYEGTDQTALTRGVITRIE